MRPAEESMIAIWDDALKAAEDCFEEGSAFIMAREVEKTEDCPTGIVFMAANDPEESETTTHCYRFHSGWFKPLDLAANMMYRLQSDVLVDYTRTHIDVFLSSCAFPSEEARKEGDTRRYRELRAIWQNRYKKGGEADGK